MSLRCGSLLGLQDFCDASDAGPKPCPRAATGGSGGMDAGAACTTPQDCAVPANECVQAVCVERSCGTANTSKGTALEKQTAGDCKTLVCDGRGGTTSEVDDLDTPAAKSACLLGTCTSGVPGMNDLASGTACKEGMGGAKGTKCDGKGACVECLSLADCTPMMCGTQGTCVPPTCMDAAHDGMETDVDCGGPVCSKCALAKACKLPRDCASGACSMGKCACLATEATCASGCADLTSDAKNCAACGHDCLGGTCTASMCQPVVLATTTGVEGIAIDAGNLYWIDGSTVMAVPIGGGNATTLASGQSPSSLAVNTANVYWLNFGSGTVMTVAKGGGTPVVLASGQTEPYAITVDATNAYWTTLGGTVMQAPLAGGSMPLQLGAGSGPNAITVDATNVYWLNPSGVWSIPIGGVGSAQQVFAGMIYEGLLHGMAVDSSYVYWTNVFSPSGGVYRAVKGGVAPATDLAPGGNPNQVAIDATSVYWTDSATNVVMKVPIAGGSPTLVALSPNSASGGGIAVDASAVYWATNSGILKIAK